MAILRFGHAKEIRPTPDSTTTMPRGALEGEVMYNECRHIKDDGQRCHAAALKTKLIASST